MTTPVGTAGAPPTAPDAPTPPRRLAAAMLLVALLTIAVAAPGAWVRATDGNHTSGDEPHYLLTAVSLAVDGDLDVADEFTDGRYRPFHEQGLRPQAAADPDGRQVVPHDPLLPALLALPWRLGGWLGAKLTLTVLAGALAALTLWTAVRRFDARLGPATVTTGALCATAPLAVYGTQVYPELPAALAVLVGVAAATGRSRARTDAVVVLALIALPWLAVKYVPVAAALAAVHLYRRWRQGRHRTVVATVGVLLAAGVVYAALHLAWYGGLTVYAAGEFFREQGGQLSVVGTDPDYLGRSRRLLGLLVDGSFGLAAWQPAWLLAPGAMAWGLRRHGSAWAQLTVPAAAGWLTATFVALTMHGWWFPGRQVVVILPLLAVAVAVWASTSRWVSWAVAGLGAAGLVTTVWLLVEGLAEELTLIVDFARTSSPTFRLLHAILPDYLEITPRTWWLHGVWLVGVVLLVAAAWRAAGRGRPSAPAASEPADARS